MEINNYIKIFNLNKLKSIEKGFYKDNNQNRKLGRVGLPWKHSNKEQELELKEYTSLKGFEFFKNKLSEMPKSLKPFLSNYSEEEYKKMGAKAYLIKEGDAGFCINKDKEIISVFSKPEKHLGKELLLEAIKLGGKYLDCIGTGHLSKFYNSLGFKEYKRMKWNPDYAPKNWDYEFFGKPDIIFFKLKK